MSKRLCVLQVTPHKPNTDHVSYFQNKDNCDFFFVTHDAENSEALQFCPNTTWTDTRNILAEKVPKEYDYYAFIDYDYVLKPQRENNVLNQMLEDLDLYNPAVLTYYPGKVGLETPFATNEKYFNSFDYSILPFSHCGLKIVHKSLLGWFFPMLTKFGGGVEACHFFNILEIAFMQHVVCSHKMIYENGSVNVNTPHNQMGDKHMHTMWNWLKPAFKPANLVYSHAPTEQDKNNAFLVKSVYQSQYTNNHIAPVKSARDVNYFNKDIFNHTFDLNHDAFDHVSPVGKRDIKDILNEITFSDLKTTNNPWISIAKKISKETEHGLITTSECVDLYQKNNGDSLFYKASNINQELLSYLQDKTVAIVGPAPYLLGQNKGSIIDSYDVVIRIQHGIPNTDDYGSRTDIIQSCLNLNYGPPLIQYLKTIDKDKRPKFIICNDTSSQPKSNGDWACVDEVYEQQFKELDIPFVHLHNNDGTWDRWALYWEIYPKKHVETFDNNRQTQYSENFNSGYGSINMILRYPIKKLAIFGLDFYNTGIPQNDTEKYHNEYTDTYGKSGTPFGPDHILHDQMSQMMHCVNVLVKDPRFQLDKEVADKIVSESVKNRIKNFLQLPKLQNETR